MISDRKLATWLLLSGLIVLASSVPLVAEKLEYNRDVRPILAENCFRCHGPDSASRKADLRLDQRAAAIEQGAWAEGDPDQSEALRRVFSTDPDEQMPPPGAHKTLTEAQKATLRQWVIEGAEYQPHWSFLAPVRPPLPDVKNASWVRNPIDRFVLARLEAAGLTPAPEADRRVLARRLSLDIVGLPPTPEVVDAFVQDPSPDAYEKLVDRLLASEHWGEHRGRFWLDAARYADTHGIHFDNYREMWTYRDWVISAFNHNMPFDRFTVEQLAGDLLPNRTLDQQIGSGFNRCNMTTSEGGAIDEEYLVLYARDRTETVSHVFLGLTTNCCVCHDHKFDPVSQREFYEMSAFFNNTTQRAMDGNIKDTPPIIQVPAAVDRARADTIAKELAANAEAAQARRNSAVESYGHWLQNVKTESLYATLPVDGLVAHAPLNDGGATAKFAVRGNIRELSFRDEILWNDAGHLASKAFVTKPNGYFEVGDVGDFERDRGFSVSAWIKPMESNQAAAILGRMNPADGYRGWDFWYENGRIAMHIVHHWSDDAIKVACRSPIPENQWTHVSVTYDGSSQAAGVKFTINGAPQPVDVAVDRLHGSIHTDVPLKIGRRNEGDASRNIAIQDLRIYDRALDAGELSRIPNTSRAVALLSKSVDQRRPEEANELFDWWLRSEDAESMKLAASRSALEQEANAIRERGTIAHVMQERNEEALAYVLFRGEYDKRRDPVKPSTPASLPPMSTDVPRNRLGLAQWLLTPEQPLTARVTVNRFWQEVFGAGIVRTTNDFGVAGELPSHPELLDWLAVDFRESGWDVKRFFKQLVMSSTYRQSAATTPEKIERDPQNRLIAHGPRYRMDAEMVRDYALASSGMLVPKIGGPSVRPYQPEGVWEAVAMIGSNTRDYRPDQGENLYRRSLYTFWKRAAPPASMEIFNAPSRETCVVRRERTNTPMQALVTLNDPQFIEAARNVAERALANCESDAARADFLAQRLLARPLQPGEIAVVTESLADLFAYFSAHGEDARQLIAVGESKANPATAPEALAAWTMIANELLNLDEVLNK